MHSSAVSSWRAADEAAGEAIGGALAVNAGLNAANHGVAVIVTVPPSAVRLGKLVQGCWGIGGLVSHRIWPGSFCPW